MVQLNNSYARACKSFDDNSTQICACDFRINLYRCDQNEFFIVTTWITLILNVSTILFCMVILYYLTKVKNQPIWLPSTRDRGIIRYLKCLLDSFVKWWMMMMLIYVCNLFLLDLDRYIYIKWSSFVIIRVSWNLLKHYKSEKK